MGVKGAWEPPWAPRRASKRRVAAEGVGAAGAGPCAAKGPGDNPRKLVAPAVGGGGAVLSKQKAATSR